MRIVFCAWRDLAHPQAGGAEMLVDCLAEGLGARGHEVALMCGGPVGDRPYRVVDLGGTYSQYLRAPLAHRAHFADWDLLVDTENGVPFFAPLWRRGRTLCLVHHVHTEQWGDRFPGPVAALGRAAERDVMPRCYRRTPFVSISPSTTSSLVDLGIPRRQIATAALNAVTTRPPSAPKDEEPLFVALGRLVPHKRMDVLLELWPRVRRQTGGRLVIIGDGPERPRLAGLLTEGAELAGKVTDEEKWDVLSRAWLLLHPAHHEGFGFVIIEAGAVGTPSIGFSVPGVRDAVLDGDSGLLVDTAEAFADRWIELGTDRARRALLGEGARRQAERFSPRRAVDRFEQLALQVVETDVGRADRWRWRPDTEERLGAEWGAPADGRSAPLTVPR